NKPALDVWYSRIDIESILASLSDPETIARARKRLAKERKRTVAKGDFPKMAEGRDGKFVIKDSPPLIYHDQRHNLLLDRENALGAFAAYRMTLPDDRRVLLDRYRMVDFAAKVVGVGSVGTFCVVALMM